MENILKGIAGLIEYIAFSSSDFASFGICYEPDMPECLRNMLNTKTESTE